MTEVNRIGAAEVQIVPSPPVLPAQSPDQALRAVAEKLEATFLSEMLKSAGLGKTPEGFGGGSGEDQFASFLRQEHANAIAARGGIGMAETLFNALKGKSDG